MVFPTTRRGAWLLLLALAVPTAWLGHTQATTPVDSANLAMKSADGRDADAMARRIGSFGDDRVLLVGFHAHGPDVGFDGADDRALAALVRDVGKVRGVRSVVAVPSPAAAERLWVIHLTRRMHGDGDDAVVAAVEGVLRTGCPPHIACEFTGQPAVEAAIAAAVADEQRTIVPAIALALFGLLLGVFRRVGLALAALAPAAVGIAWTGGLFALTGHSLDPVAALLQPGDNDPLRILPATHPLRVDTEQLAARLGGVEPFDVLVPAHGAPRAAAVVSALQRAGRPVVVTSLVLGTGFLVAGFGRLSTTSEFGLLAALTIVVAAVVSLFLVPALLLVGRGGSGR